MLVKDHLEIKVKIIPVYSPLFEIFVELISFKINGISDWPLKFFWMQLSISGNDQIGENLPHWVSPGKCFLGLLGLSGSIYIITWCFLNSQLLQMVALCLFYHFHSTPPQPQPISLAPYLHWPEISANL